MNEYEVFEIRKKPEETNYIKSVCNGCKFYYGELDECMASKSENDCKGVKKND